MVDSTGCHPVYSGFQLRGNFVYDKTAFAIKIQCVTRQLILQYDSDVCPHILMVHKSERSAVFRAFCHLSQSKIYINGRLPDSILTDLKVFVQCRVRSEYLMKVYQLTGTFLFHANWSHLGSL